MFLFKFPLFFLFIVMLCPSFSSGKWQGRFFMEKGVAVVENKGEGIWGEEIEKRFPLRRSFPWELIWVMKILFLGILYI